jgi:hypothetical protein
MTSDEFRIDDAKRQKIADGFHVLKKDVESLKAAYDIFSEYFKEQYLAHFMRGIECFVRKNLEDKRFIIVCEPFGEKTARPDQKPVVSSLYTSKKRIRSNTNKTNSFIIHYDERLDPKERRDYIAHEIGHLLLKITGVMPSKNPMHEWRKVPVNANKRSAIEETLSSIFGVFIMSEKNDFYLNFKFSEINHESWQELFDFFLNYS